ncbi:MAG: aspartate 1-decarboxylase [Candidatus Krumholzibacteria bacterium]|nr:aspartate 1-decarboxylase [Candidatus Krumholzibacteria bacterium]
MFPPLSPILIRNVIYPVYRGFRGDTLLAALEELEKNQWLSPKELEDLWWKRLWSLISQSALYVPYYRDAFRQANLKSEDIQNPADFEQLPFLTKDAIRGAGNRIVSQDPLRRGFASSTGGSTGEPLYFYGDVAAGPIRRANTMRGYRWMGVDIGDRQAMLWGMHLDVPLRERLVSTVKNYFSNIMYLSTFDMSDQSMLGYASRLRKYKPRLFTGYPSALALFAGFCQGRHIMDIRPRAIISSGEELYESQRELIEAVFGCRVFDRYGSREFANVAQECDEHRGLHIMNDLFYVEIIAANGKRANEGEVGEVVVTDLSNYYMPFIRYRTGDLAVSTGGICKCGRGLPLLDRIEGRSFDSIVTPEGKHVGAFFWTWLSRAVPGIRRFQIEQRERSGIVFRFVPGPEWRAENERRLESKIRETCGEGFRVTFAQVDDIPLTVSGKSKFIISNIGERLVAKSKIHRATVTGEFPERPDGIIIDVELMDLSSVSPGEKVLIVDMTNGERVDTFAVPGPKGSGAIAATGATAKRIRTGDRISIMAFTWAEGPLERFSNILVDDANRFVKFLTEIAGDRI